MSRVCTFSVAFGVSVFMAWPALGADFFFDPISASGSHTIAGNLITLDGGGQTVTLELRMDAWDPVPDVGVCGDLSLCSIGAQDCAVGACVGSNGLLNTYQARIDGSGYGGVLSPVPMPGNQLIDVNHPDFVFSGLTAIPAVDTSSDNWAYGALLLFSSDSIPYPGVDKYGGTLVIDVPLGAAGEFTIGFFDDLNQTFMEDSTPVAIVPINSTPAVIRVLCALDAECDDGDACTDDTCELDGTCTHAPNYNPAVECCDPVTGGLTVIDDGNECTEDICNPDGSVDHPPAPPGSPCGDPSSTECDLPDTCDGAGVCEPNPTAWGAPCGDPVDTDCTDPDSCDGAGACLANHEVPGTPCGDPDTTDCTDPDSCDANGTCVPNHRPAGTPCGDPSSTDCDNPDECTGGGACSPNPAPNGTPCDDGVFCNVDEACADGTCGGGGPRDCSDGLGCTDDWCNEAATACEHDLLAGFCLITGACRSDGAVNPANDCEECDPVTSTGAWSNRPDGTACDDGLFCNVDEDCLAGSCGGGGARDCEEGVGCTDDACNEATNQCDHTPIDALCPDDGLFCNGDEYCDPATDCDHTGSPCGGPCDEVNDTCSCDAPFVEDVASRYMKISPMPADSTAPMALVVTADITCPTGDPIPMYVTAPIEFDLEFHGPFANLGILSTDPADAVYLTPAEWGELYVTGEFFTPETTYVVVADCGSPGSPGFSDPGVGTPFTRKWADLDDSGVVTFFDILTVVQTFQGIYALASKDESDLLGNTGTLCLPNQMINFVDIIAAVEAFQGVSFENRCDDSCP